MKKTAVLLTLVLLMSIVALSGCENETGSTAQSSSDSKVSNIDEKQKQMDILATATHAYVDAMAKNWDADAEDDGIVIYPELKDSRDDTVKFEGVGLKVDIEIWTTKLNDDWKEVKDRLIYSGSGTIDSWKDGNFLFDGGIKIPYEDIKAIQSDNGYGEFLVKIHTPDTKTYEAKSGVRIKPE